MACGFTFDKNFMRTTGIVIAAVGLFLVIWFLAGYCLAKNTYGRYRDAIQIKMESNIL